MENEEKRWKMSGRSQKYKYKIKMKNEIKIIVKNRTQQKREDQ